MLKEKKFFKFFWFFVRFIGLQPHKLERKEKIRAIALFILLYILNFALFIVQLMKTKNAEERIQCIQTFPSFIIFFLDAFNFERKSKKIEELFNEMCETINESGEQKIFNEAYKQTMRIIKPLIAFVVVSVGLNAVVFYITAKSGVPIYIPIDHGPIFIAIWLVQNLFFCYCTCCSLLLDSFLFIFISMLNANSICIGKKFGKISHGNKTEMVKCLEDHQRFKR
jgi:hypothetical protein